MARRRRSYGLGAFGNVTATNALRSFQTAVSAVARAAKTVADQQAAGMPAPGTVLSAITTARKALADAQQAAAIATAQGAFHRDFRAILGRAVNAVASLADAEKQATDLAQFAQEGAGAQHVWESGETGQEYTGADSTYYRPGGAEDGGYMARLRKGSPGFEGLRRGRRRRVWRA